MTEARKIPDEYRIAIRHGERRLAQSQASVSDQLNLLRQIAVRLGLWDAADWIRDALDWNAP